MRCDDGTCRRCCNGLDSFVHGLSHPFIAEECHLVRGERALVIGDEVLRAAIDLQRGNGLAR